MLQMCFDTSYEETNLKADLQLFITEEKKPLTNKIDTFAQFCSDMITSSLKNSCFSPEFSHRCFFLSFYILFTDLLTITQLLSYF